MPLLKATARVRPFHLRYLELCKSRNALPVPEVKVKNKDFTTLDFFGDRIKIDDWISIFNALFYDTSLRYVAIKLRKNNLNVLENINSMKKARKLHGPPVILTHILLTQLVDTVSNLMQHNEHLTTLILEGLPLKKAFITYLATGLSENRSIKNLSFARSALGDEGCEIICSNIKCLTNIDCLNLTQCQISPKGAESLADLIKFQKIVRFTKGWESTLRYQTIDPDVLPGLKRITINENPIKDKGLYFIMEILKEDIWIKCLEVQNCGLTDEGAAMISECLDYNSTLLVIDIQNNPKISMECIERIKMQLGGDSEESSLDSEQDGKVSVSQLKEQIKMLESQLHNEQFRQRQMEALNESLRIQLNETQKKLASGDSIPSGFTLIKVEHLDQLIEERDQMAANLEKNVVENIHKKSHRQATTKKHIISRVSKAKSEIVQKEESPKRPARLHSRQRYPSEERPFMSPRKVPFIETNIGDTCENVADRGERTEEDILKIFMKKKTNADYHEGDPDGHNTQ